ncbi:unnamed protein product [Trichogramma brassicae]|uniref:Uncharacterized protein n=1 Tax=Trichogramma brassicae TaxID=86971 RepID=A0A6H5IGG7_9HYME|nr:unnamed protein product [Trichogramma brassicae]
MRVTNRESAAHFAVKNVTKPIHCCSLERTGYPPIQYIIGESVNNITDHWGFTHLVQRFLGPDRNINACRPLHLAARNRHADIVVNLLLMEGVSPDSLDTARGRPHCTDLLDYTFVTVLEDWMAQFTFAPCTSQSSRSFTCSSIAERTSKRKIPMDTPHSSWLYCTGMWSSWRRYCNMARSCPMIFPSMNLMKTQ